MTVDTQQYYGQMETTTTQGAYNALRFAVQQQMMNLQTCLPVEVLSVSGAGLNPVGFVTVRVMVASITGDDKVVDYPEIPNIPYFRLQGGANAIIIDPEPGDIGMAAFCSRDISAVKSARMAAPPGSRRAYDFSDAMYIGGFLNAAPTQYIQFSAEGIIVHSPAKVRVEAPAVHVDSPQVLLGQLENDVRALIDERLIEAFNNHQHEGGGIPDTPLTLEGVATTATKAN